MNALSRVLYLVLALVVIAGCAQTTVTSSDPYMGERIARPNRIIVHDFAANPADIPPGSAVAGQYAQHSAPQTPKEIEVGRYLGAQVGKELVADIQKMGLPAVGAAGQPAPQAGDIVIMGYFESVDQGSAAKRMTIGFGSGGSQLTTLIEGYQVTAQGLRKLGSATMAAEGSKGPGAGVGAATWAITGSPVGLAVSGGMKLYGEASGSATVEGRAKQTAKEIAEKLKARFQEEGWISR